MSDTDAMEIVGTGDRNLKALSQAFACEISFRDNAFLIQECDEETYKRIKIVLHALYEQIQRKKRIAEQDVVYASRLALRDEEIRFEELDEVIVGRTMSGKPVVPRTHGQKAFVDAMNENAIVFAIGPAGTGKTYLAVVKAVSALKKGEVKRIVLTRPAVEAGENLGFLPGDLKEKVDPYLTPLYDALHDMLGNEQTEKLMERGNIEVAPLAYMRGRTLNDSYVILDEAQNTTGPQMKMFLTRLGFHSRMIITGDITQIDLDRRTPSGLLQASEILKGIEGIKIMRLSADDVVRHPLVQKIIERYAEHE
ncbi:MAG: PhoH family protein [Solobacterium sp.]|nr:PhoH family protein [Solobacterium sp.]